MSSSDDSTTSKKRKIKTKEYIKVGENISRGIFLADMGEEQKKLPIQGGVPGDIVDVRIVKAKKGKQGKITKIHSHSSLREEAICTHFGVCGGCKWQNIGYLHQLAFKRNQVIEAFKSLSIPDVPEALAVKTPTYYRNKLEFSFSNRRWRIAEESEQSHTNALGFHVPGRFDKIVDIEHCYLQQDPSNAIRLAIREYAREQSLSFYDLVKHEGFLRNLVVRTSSTGQIMVIVIVAYEDPSLREPLLQFIRDRFAEITSLFYIINSKKNDSYGDLPAHFHSGKEYIVETLGDLELKISPHSFFQTNSLQCRRLYSVIEEFAELQGHENVYDLYTGIGSIALFLARQVNKVVGIEYVEAAIANARENCQHNKIDNASFYAGDVLELLSNDFIAQHGQPDIVITDPPRAGMNSKVVKKLTQLGAKKIVYVSCNPQTQAQDIELLRDDYAIVKVQPVDMFPHTHHIENVVLLVKKT